MLKIDLMRLDSPERFQSLCTRLACREYPKAIPVASASWDGGCDIISITPTGRRNKFREIVWQVKFSKNLNAHTKRAICKSIESLKKQGDETVIRWILCLPVDPTDKFLQWLSEQIPKEWRWEVWGAATINEKLENNPDILQTFFYPIYEELRMVFAVENLELVRVSLDPGCDWNQPDENVLNFASKNVNSPDLVLDIVVRNTGRFDAVLLGIDVEMSDWQVQLHGFPGSGLLFSQIEYVVPIKSGHPGHYRTACEPPLVVRGESVERFKIRLSDTGYAWRGTASISLNYGPGKCLPLPAFRLYT